MTLRKLQEFPSSNVLKFPFPIFAAERNGAPSPEAPGWFHKELIREGHYEHPTDGWAMDVTREDLDKWAATFRSMDSAGIEVPVPDGHTSAARANTGFVREVYVAENEDGTASLWAWHEIRDPKAAAGIRAGTITGVSVSLLPSIKDHTGKDHGPGLEHVALTPYPVAHECGPFAEAAAALAASGRTALLFSRSGGDPASFAGRVSSGSWEAVDLAALPASCFLLVKDTADPSTWSLPVYEGLGDLVEVGGRKVHKARGALNAQAVDKAAQAILSGQVPEGERERLAAKVAGLFRHLGKEPPAGLVKPVERKESGMNREQALKFARSFGITVADDANEEALAKAVKEALAKAEAAETERRDLAARKDRDEAERRDLAAKVAKAEADVAEARRELAARTAAERVTTTRAALAKAEETVQAALKRGALTEPGAVAFRSLLSLVADKPKGFSLAADGNLVEAEVDVVKAATDLVASLPDGAALDMAERTRRTHNGTLVALSAGGKDPTVTADETAVENLMLIGQPVPSYLLSRCGAEVKDKATEHNKGFGRAR